MWLSFHPRLCPVSTDQVTGNDFGGRLGWLCCCLWFYNCMSTIALAALEYKAFTAARQSLKSKGPLSAEDKARLKKEFAGIVLKAIGAASNAPLAFNWIRPGGPFLTTQQYGLLGLLGSVPRLLAALLA